ncbi:META domain-containing protein [Streptomyces piniterrae]|nr:META domain-containing protein [Streptomyces piniterrae]
MDNRRPPPGALLRNQLKPNYPVEEIRGHPTHNSRQLLVNIRWWNWSSVKDVEVGMRISLRRVAGVVAGIAVVCGGVSACGATSGGEGGRSGGVTASASPAKKGPGGPGGRLFDGIWTFDDDTLTVDGQEVRAPENASPWIEFRDDGTVAGDYGCTPFRVKAELEATTLTLGEDAPALAPPPTPAWHDETTSCPKPAQQKDIASSASPDAQQPKAAGLVQRSPELSDFEAKVKKFFHRGLLKIGEKKLPEEPGGPPPGSLPQLRNEHGDVATLTIIRSPAFFDTEFQLDAWMEYDHTEGFQSAKDTSFVFHRDGTVTGKLGCNDFTARVFFNGFHLFFRDTRLTTHRTCAAQNMRDEAFVFGMLKRSLNYCYVGDSGGIYMRDDVGDEHRATGFQFRSVTDQ